MFWTINVSCCNCHRHCMSHTRQLCTHTDSCSCVWFVWEHHLEVYCACGCVVEYCNTECHWSCTTNDLYAWSLLVHARDYECIIWFCRVTFENLFLSLPWSWLFWQIFMTFHVFHANGRHTLSFLDLLSLVIWH
jgi:hypothetical protein